MSAIEKLTKRDIRLPSPPAIVVRILEAVANKDTTFEDLAQIIRSDPALAAKTLKIVNSSFYGLVQKVDSLTKALSILGFKTIQNICLSFAIAHELRTESEGGFDFDFFWRRSVTSAVAAELITKFIDKKNEASFVLGLLQDIGIAVMYFCQPEDYLRVLNEKITSTSPIETIEKSIFGFDHQELSSEILKEWELPESIYLPIKYHHYNNGIPSEYKTSIDIIYLADKISSVYHGNDSSDKFDEILKIFETRYGKTSSESTGFIDKVAEKSVEVLSLFEIDPSNMKPYSQILEEANKALSEVNLNYEKLLVKFKESIDKAQKLAEQLKIANEKLNSLAVRDSLTGLYNHGFFQESLDKEFNRTKRNGKPFTILMIDIDSFKNINDTYGHQTGDTVLKKLSQVISKQVRRNDILARYGGDEFSVVAPETDLKSGTVLGERIRKSIEQAQFQIGQGIIRITASVGVASFQPKNNEVTKQQLFNAVDSALYKSKHEGKNTLNAAKLTSHQLKGLKSVLSNG